MKPGNDWKSSHRQGILIKKVEEGDRGSEDICDGHVSWGGKVDRRKVGWLGMR